MPAFTFEKITPPPNRGPIATIAVKKRGVIVQILDRFVEARVKKQKTAASRAKRSKKG